MKKICFVLSVIFCMTFVFNGFVTYGAKDNKAPKVVSSNPKNKKKNVAVNKKITVKFSEKIVKGAKFKKIKLLKGKKAVVAKVKISGKTLKVTPKSKLAKGTKYTLQIPAKAVRDRAKNNLKKAYKVTFTTKKTTDSQEKVALTPLPSPTPLLEPYWDVEGTPAVKYIGRFDFARSPAEISTTWPGAIIDAWFEGTEVSAKLKANNCYVQVIVDGENLGAIAVTSEKHYELAKDLKPGIHNVKIIKRNEGWQPLAFKGFEFNGGRLLAPEPELERKIEFVGDSITCGYGSDATTNNESYSEANSSAYDAYGSIVARSLNAEQHTIAVSGIGVFSMSGPGVIQKVYDRLNLTSGTWDFSKWQPQVVVVNICTNDMKSRYSDDGVSLPSKEKFGDAYIELLTKIRANNPNAHIICSVGSMLSGAGLDRAKEGVKYAISKFGDSKVSYFEFDTQLPYDGYGADAHPSKKTHLKMATALSAEIKRITGWK